MEFLTIFKSVTKKDKEKVSDILIHDSTPDFDFYLMVILSILMASFGVVINSEAVIIGSMLLAPIMSPILAFSLGIVTKSYKLTKRSLITIGKVIFLAFFIAFFISVLFASSDLVFFDSVLSRTEPSFIHFAIAVISGLAVSYSLVKPELSASLPGVAVAVSLMPPLVVSGVGLAVLEFDIFSGAFVLFLLNMIGIVLVSVFSFSIMNMNKLKGYIDSKIAEENKRIKSEKKKSREIMEEFKEEIINNK